MAFMIPNGCAIFLFTITQNEHVLANSCENDNCTVAIDIPLITKINAPLKAELDISVLTVQLKELIVNEVEQAVSVAMKDLAENIVNKRTQSALENLQAFNNLTILTSLHEMEDVTARKKDVLTMQEKLEEEIEQMKEQQKLTELKLSGVEAEFHKSTKRELQLSVKSTMGRKRDVVTELFAMTAHPSSGRDISNTIMKFDDVKYSVGISKLSTYMTTGKFTCEHEGLYLISASVMYSNSARYYIVLNGDNISQTYIGQQSGNTVFTGAVTVTRELNLHDEVWLYAEGSWYLYSGLFSKLTVIKIK